MDSKSHELLTEILLKATNKTNISTQWGNCPDIDISFLHRWYRHRISVIQKTYDEFPNTWKEDKEHLITQDKDAVALCIVSHNYLDIFNGWVYPFGIWHIITPEKTIINELTENIYRPTIFIEILKELTGSEPYIQQFYIDSKKLMEKLIIPNTSIEQLTSQFVNRLSTHISENITIKNQLYKNAMNQIIKFTNNNKYNQDNIYSNQTNDIFLQFETSYINLIDKTLDNIQ